MRELGRRSDGNAKFVISLRPARQSRFFSFHDSSTSHAIDVGLLSHRCLMNTTIRELNFIRISSRARCSRRPTVTGNSIGRFVVDGIRWLRPLRRSRPLRILPRSHVTKLTSALTRARPTELFRKVLRRHLAQQISLIATSQNVNFLHRHRIEEALDHTEHRREARRSG